MPAPGVGMTPAFESLQKHLKQLPGLGFRSSERIALHLLVEKPARLVFKAVAEALDGTKYLESVTEVTFEEQGSRTRLTVKANARGLHPMAPQMLAGMDAGWSQSLEKLETLVVAMAK